MEAVLRIRAQDDTAAALEAIKAKILGIEKNIGSLDKFTSAVGKVVSSTDPLASSLLSAEQALAGQRTELAGVVAALDRVIAPTDRAAAAQRSLAKSVETTTAALSRQGAAGTKAAERSAGAAASAGRHGGGVIPLGVGGVVESIKGFAPFAVALEAFEVGKKAVENAGELEQQRFRIRELSRNDPSEAPLADRLAAEVAAKYPGITQSRALDTYSELRANAVDLHGRVDPEIARRNLMTAARAQNSALALGFDMTPTDMQNLLKGVEGSGRANDPKAVEKISDAYLRAKQVFGSAIASDMIRDYTANAKSANFSIGDDQFYLSNMVRMSEGNASRLGNEVNQTLATMVGGHMTKATGAWMVAHGLARPDQVVKTGPGTISIKGGLKDEATLQTDQGKWAATTLRKAIEDSGAVSEAKVSARAQMLADAELKRNPNADIDPRFMRERAEEGLIAAELAKTGMRSTVTDNLAHFIGNQRLIERDTAAMQNGSGISAGDRIGQNPIAAFSELSSAISNFGTVLLGPAISNSGPILHAMAQGVSALSTALLNAEVALSKGGKYLSHLLFPDAPAPPPVDFDWLVRAAYARQADDHPQLSGIRDMEGANGRALSRLIEGGHTSATPIPPQDVHVSGDARISTVVTVTASSELLSIVEKAKTIETQMALNPIQGGHSGRMDSEAAPLGGGIGHR